MLVNERLKNKVIVTKHGKVSFNNKGESKDLNKTQQQALAKLPHFEFIDDAPKKEKPATKAKPKAKPKEDKQEKEEKE